MAVEDFGWGFTVRSDRVFPISSEHNRRIVVDDVSPSDVIGIAETTFGAVPHKVNWDHESYRSASGPFRAAGYDASTDLIMALTAPTSFVPPHDVGRVRGEQRDRAVEAAWMRAGMTEFEAAVLTARRLLEQAVDVEYVAVHQADEFTSDCELRVHHSVAQIDAVLTDPRLGRREASV